jgi:hypothetical protein
MTPNARVKPDENDTSYNGYEVLTAVITNSRPLIFWDIRQNSACRVYLAGYFFLWGGT